MKLTVLGKYGPYPAAKGATSGYLLSHNGTNILLECGSGILSRLQEYISISAIDAIILSHLHSDHISDMFVLNYALQQLGALGSAALPVKVFAPDEPSKENASLRAMNTFEFTTLQDGLKGRLGSLELSFFEVSHPFKSFGMCAFDDAKRFVYTGDTRYFAGIEQRVANADLLLADAGLLRIEKTNEMVPHLTAGECGQVAKKANAKRLLCTHFSPRASEDAIRAEVSEFFPSAELARERTTYEI